jgi:hypothetical protein
MVKLCLPCNRCTRIPCRHFWTASAFYGHITEKYSVECSYQTVLRLLHEKGYVLKVPKPWPDRQDELLREELTDRLRRLIKDRAVELWYADETVCRGRTQTSKRVGNQGDTAESNTQWSDHALCDLMDNP